MNSALAPGAIHAILIGEKESSFCAMAIFHDVGCFQKFKPEMDISTNPFVAIPFGKTRPFANSLEVRSVERNMHGKQASECFVKKRNGIINGLRLHSA